jgi:ribosomal protein S18 acetylase RimI-like enzyme
MNQTGGHTYSIRLATAQDIRSLDVLVNSAYRGSSSKQGWTTEADLLDGIRTNSEALHKLIADPTAVILNHIDPDGRIQGCVYLKNNGSRLYLGMLTVSPKLQAMGIGKQLLDAAECYAAKQGCNSIIMTVISVRAELIAWYRRHGYRPTGKTEPFPTDSGFGIPKQPLHFIEMEKQL